jgi:hypothetical protein
MLAKLFSSRHGVAANQASTLYYKMHMNCEPKKIDLF